MHSCALPLPLRSRVVLTLPAILKHCKDTNTFKNTQISTKYITMLNKTKPRINHCLVKRVGDVPASAKKIVPVILTDSGHPLKKPHASQAQISICLSLCCQRPEQKPYLFGSVSSCTPTSIPIYLYAGRTALYHRHQ